VELALVLTFLIPLFVLALDLARAYRQYIIITDCARSGALWLSDPVAQAQSGYYQTYQDAALANAPGLTASNLSSSSRTDANGNTYQSVTVTYNFTLVTGFEGANITIPLTRTVQVRVAPTLPNFS